MNEKKVVAVIVEGPSDENALGGILKEFFSSEEVQFAVVHGDITSDKNTTTDNVLKRIDKLIDGLRSRYGYQWDDFIRIIHIADTDGTFTKDCVMESDNDAVRYHEDFIEAPNVEALIKRNECKAQIMLKLHSTGKVHGIKYRLFYNSCNLEHVLYNELKDFSDEEKEALSDDFAEKYEGKVKEFIDFISNPELAVPGTYKQTWDYIIKDKNSLKRHTNMNMIFKQ
ncbi:MAG: hypothetical protein IJM37_09705 [Lachnospiraceae bacterium]|nr:hypothetical protein [Lachnospiraceae bacterium]